MDVIEIEDLTSSYDLDNVKDGFKRILKLTLSTSSKLRVLDNIKKLEQREDIYFAEPNYIFDINEEELIDYSNETYWSNYIDKIGGSEIWNYATGKGIKIGVIDYGINKNHPNLVGQIDENLSEVFVFGENDIFNSPNSHGTSVAGIMVAKDNGNDVKGLAYDAKVVGLKIDYNGSPSESCIAEAINYANEIGLKLLNCSFKLTANCNYLGTIRQAIQNFNGLVICSAGNENWDNEIFVHNPSAFEFDNIIAVGASTMNDTKADFSNYGLNSVDLFAPGEEFKVCYGDNSYIIDGGTSFAAPLVTAACALIMEVKPTLSLIEIKNIILDTVDNISSLSDLCVSGERLNVLKALRKVNVHNHDFTYRTVDLRQHRMTCKICGYSALSPHVVKNGSFTGQKYAVCLLCGGLCEMGFVHLGW